MNDLDFLRFVTIFTHRKAEEEKKLPYHINVIDQLHINENGHSRILMQLLSYINEENQYEFLVSLIDYIKMRTPEFGKINVQKPIITQEKERIDLWIRDEGYAIIFENKVYNAEDQEAQLMRYIDKTRQQYSTDRIFVVYLSRDGNEPDEQSWGPYKEVFKGRYINLPFNDEILPWLRLSVLPHVRPKDIYLQSAIVQYIDYLEGIFNVRTIYNRMDKELNEMIAKEYSLSGKNSQECVGILTDKIKKANEVIAQMVRLRDCHRQKVFDEWRGKTKALYPDLHPCERFGWYKTDVTIDIHEETCAYVYIGEDPDGSLYCNFELSDTIGDEPLEAIFREMEELFTILPEKKTTNPRLIFNHHAPNDFDGAFSDFCKVVEISKRKYGK